MKTHFGNRPVAFDVSTLLVKHPSGIRVYGEGLIRALAALRPDRRHVQIYRWQRAAHRRYLPDPRLPARPFASGSRLHRRFGLVHALDTHIPVKFRGPLVATLFDVISALPFAAEKKFSSPGFMARKLRDYGQIARRADLVITLSEETRRRFLSLEQPRAPVVVIPPGVDPEFLAAGSRPENSAELKRLGIHYPYLLVVGAFYPRKNLELALETFLRAQARMQELMFVAVGEPGPEWSSSPAKSKLEQAGKRVRLPGYLNRASLAAVYAGASLLLYLSHYEGFGLPVLEAMACGTPVIASRRGGIPESGGEAALLVDPGSPAEVEAAVERVLHDASCRKRLRDLGLGQAASFTWERAASAVDSAYDEACASWRAGAAGSGNPFV